MRRGAQARYGWTVNGGNVNFDTHGEPPNAARGFYNGYGTGRAATADQGTLTAAFELTHGWFFRIRSGRTVSRSRCAPRATTRRSSGRDLLPRLHGPEPTFPSD